MILADRETMRVEAQTKATNTHTEIDGVSLCVVWNVDVRHRKCGFIVSHLLPAGSPLRPDQGEGVRRECV